MGDVEWEVIRVDDASDEAEVLWHHVFEIARDKYTPHVHLDGVSSLSVVVVHAGWGSVWDEEDGSESDFTFCGKVNVAHWGLAISLGESVEERGVLFFSDFRLLTRPDWLVRVDDFPVPDSLLDHLWLGVFFL